METALLVVAVAIAGLACPAMMWWQRRKGRDPACCVPITRNDSAGQSTAADEAALRRRNAELEERLAALRADQRD